MNYPIRNAVLRCLVVGIGVLFLFSIVKSQDRSTPPKPDPEKWELVAGGVGDDSLDMYYYRKDSLVKLEPNIFKFWLRAYKFDNVKKWKPGYNLLLLHVDCKKERWRMPSFMVYGENEKYDDNKSFDDSKAEWMDLPPDTAITIAATKLCKRAILL